MKEKINGFNTLNSNPSLINRHLIFDNGVKGKILSLDENKNLLIFCNPIPDDITVLRTSFRKLNSTLDDWLKQSFDKNELSVYFENTRFSFSNLKEGECYDEVNLENNSETEYLDKVGSISYRQAIALGAKRVICPPEMEEDPYILFDNMKYRGGCWMSTSFSNHHPKHLTQSYVLSKEGMILTDDLFNRHQVAPLICISGNVLYDGGTGSSDDPIKVLKERLK